METIAALAAKKAQLEAELSALREEIASLAGQTDEPKSAPKPRGKGK